MKATKRKPSLWVFYLLLIGVGSLLAHLASEFASMGADADNVIFSVRHWYLGLGALVGVIVFIVCGRRLLRSADNPRDLKRILSQGLASLPYAGNGCRFLAATAAFQLALGALTQIGEGCPFCGHDVIAGVFGALLTVVLFALITRAVGLRLPTLVSALAGYASRQVPVAGTFIAACESTDHKPGLGTWSPFLFNRPPPLQLQPSY